MMYNQKLVAVLKQNGRILREHGSTIQIPFGTEYSISMKNLENRKAVAKIEIDGVNVLGTHSVILDPQMEVNIERFITNGDLNRGNRFKFIKKTKEISDYRGDKIDDGIIKIEFRFEKELNLRVPFVSFQMTDNSRFENMSAPREDRNEYMDWMETGERGICEPPSFSSSYRSMTRGNVQQCCAKTFSASMISESKVEDGITVKGSISNQGFQFGYVRELEDNFHTIVFNLKGYDSNKKKITRLVTVRTKIKCETCGRRSKSSNQFCPNCGTSLI